MFKKNIKERWILNRRFALPYESENYITGREAQPCTQVLLRAWLLSGKSQSEPRLILGTRVWGERRGGAPHLPNEIPAGAEAPTEKPSFGKHGMHRQSKAQADKQAPSAAGCSFMLLPSALLHPWRAVAAWRNRA